MYYKACAKHVPILRCTTKLAQSTSKYYFVLQYCTRYFSIILCTTKLAQSPSQYYFVLQNKALPNTTLYYKASTEHFPILLCTTKLVPILLCTLELAQRKLLHTAHSFTEASIHSKLFSEKLLQTTTFSTEKLLHTASFYTQQAFTHRTLLHRVLLHMASVYPHRNIYTEKFSHKEKLLHTANFYTQHFLHTAFFTHSKLLQKQMAQRNFPLHNDNRNCSSKTGPRRQLHRLPLPTTRVLGEPTTKSTLLAQDARSPQALTFLPPWRSRYGTLCPTLEQRRGARVKCKRWKVEVPCSCYTSRFVQCAACQLHGSLGFQEESHTHTETPFTHGRFYTQTLSHTQTLLHTDSSQRRLHTETFTHRNSFTHKYFHI